MLLLCRGKYVLKIVSYFLWCWILELVHMSCLMKLKILWMLFSYHRYKVPFKFRGTQRSLMRNNKLISCTALIFPLNAQILQSILFFSYTVPKIFTAAISVRIQNPLGRRGVRNSVKVEKLRWRRKNRIRLLWIQLSILKCLQRAHPVFLDQMERAVWCKILSIPNPAVRRNGEAVPVRN